MSPARPTRHLAGRVSASRRAVVGLCVLAWSSMAWDARAADVDDSFQRGLDLQGQGRFAEALVAFQRSQARDPSVVTRLHVAECEVGAGRWLRAEDHLREVMATHVEDDTPPAIRDAVVAARADLAALMPRIPRLRIVVVSPDDTARRVRVEIDGDGYDPAAVAVPIRVDPGSHRVVATTNLHERAAETVTAREGETTAVALVLERAPVRDPRAAPLRTAGLAAIAIGSSLMPATTVLLVLGGLKNFCIRLGPRECPHEGDDLITAALVLGGSGLAALVTGGVLLGLSARSRPSDPPIPDSEIYAAALRVPTWDRERFAVPNTPPVVTLYRGVF